MSPVVRTVLFWVMMIALAIVLWQMASKGGPSPSPSQTMNYSDFMNEGDKNNIASAKLLESPATAVVQGQLRDSAQKFSVTIPKEVIPDLTEQLRKQGTTVDVAEIRDLTPVSKALNVAPFAIIIAIWIYVLSRRQKRQSPPQQSGPGNGPLG